MRNGGIMKNKKNNLLTEEEWMQKADAIYNHVMKNCDAEDIWDVMHFGLAHIVWEDGNYQPHHIRLCISDYEDKVAEGKYSKEALDWTLWSLNQLLLLPEYNPEWYNYDEK